VPYVLDTDTVSAFQYRNRDVVARVRAQPDSEIFVTIVTLQEQMAGQLSVLNRQLKPDALITAYDELLRTSAFYGTANVLRYDAAAARIENDLRKNLRRMGTFDRRIAAITLAHGHTLVTRNTVDFRGVPALGLEDWMAS